MVYPILLFIYPLFTIYYYFYIILNVWLYYFTAKYIFVVILSDGDSPVL